MTKKTKTILGVGLIILFLTAGALIWQEIFGNAARAQSVCQVGPAMGDDTNQIQQAIDNCAGGGEARLTSGETYTAGTIVLRSGVTFNLNNATLQAADDENAFQWSSFVTTQRGANASNIKLIGPGTISKTPGNTAGQVHLVWFEGNNDIEIRNLTIDSTMANTDEADGNHLRINGGENILIEDVTVKGTQAKWHWHTDGIALAKVKNGVVRGCDIITTDDGLWAGGGSSNILFEDCSVSSWTTALEIGTSPSEPGGSDLSNITFRDMYVYNSGLAIPDGGGIVFKFQNAGLVENINFEGITIGDNVTHWVYAQDSPSGDPDSVVRDLCFDNIAVQSGIGGGSKVMGDGDTRVENMIFSDIEFQGGSTPYVYFDDIDGLTIANSGNESDYDFAWDIDMSNVTVTPESMDCGEGPPPPPPPECNCVWQDRGCGQGPCASEAMYQVKVCTPIDCEPEESRCSFGDPSCQPSEQPVCFDGLDNDSDGWIDFPLDSGCSSTADGSEDSEGSRQCNNKVDDDEDGLVDKADPNCSFSSDKESEEEPPIPPEYQEEIEDIRQKIGLLRLGVFGNEILRAGCQALDPLLKEEPFILESICQEVLGFEEGEIALCQLREDTIASLEREGVECSCSDWEINACGAGSCEANTMLKERVCEPTGCGIESICAFDDSCGTIPLTGCFDGIDNDGDGWVDYPEDRGCSSKGDVSEDSEGIYQCNDDFDNDADGWIDFDDPNCLSSFGEESIKSYSFEEFCAVEKDHQEWWEKNICGPEPPPGAGWAKEYDDWTNCLNFSQRLTKDTSKTLCSEGTSRLCQEWRATLAMKSQCLNYEELKKAAKDECGGEENCQLRREKIKKLYIDFGWQPKDIPKLIEIEGDETGPSQELKKVREVCQTKRTDIKTPLEEIMGVYAILLGIESGSLFYRGIETSYKDALHAYFNVSNLIAVIKNLPEYYKNMAENEAGTGFSFDPVQCVAAPASGAGGITSAVGGPVCPQVSHLFAAVESNFSYIRQNTVNIDLIRRKKEWLDIDIMGLTLPLLAKYPIKYHSIDSLVDEARNIRARARNAWALAVAIDFASQNCTCGQSYCKLPICVSGLPLTLSPLKNPNCWLVTVLRPIFLKQIKTLENYLE